MNYRWFMPTRGFFAATEPCLTASGYAASLDSLAAGIGQPHLKAMMNLTASHDTPRFGTSIYNPGRYKYQNSPREDSTYRIDRPDERTRRVQEMILVQQFTYVGAPHIWNGDEVGMWGADDPDERKPMVWADLRYEDEEMHPFGRTRHRDRVAPDTALFRVYRDLIGVRKQHLRLFADGTAELAPHGRRAPAAGVRARAGRPAGRRGVQPLRRVGEVVGGSGGKVCSRLPAGPRPATVAGDSLSITIPPRSAVVWIREDAQ